MRAPYFAAMFALLAASPLCRAPAQSMCDAIEYDLGAPFMGNCHAEEAYRQQQQMELRRQREEDDFRRQAEADAQRSLDELDRIARDRRDADAARTQRHREITEELRRPYPGPTGPTASPRADFVMPEIKILDMQAPAIQVPPCVPGCGAKQVAQPK
jgi:hypothetical protein